MTFSSFSFFLTEDCNFECSYCSQKKQKRYMKRSTIEKAAAFFYPRLAEEAFVLFYGGEPLLAFDLIKYAVSLFQEKNRQQKKKLTFSLTSNGSLLTDNILPFLDRHRFTLLLSFDGLNQETNRKPGSLGPTLELIRRLQNGRFPNIDFSIHSVYPPGNIGHLSASLRYTIETGASDISFSIAEDRPWDKAAITTLEKEIGRLREFLVGYYKKKGTIPLSNFRPKPQKKSPGCFYCAGGRYRMAIAPEEELWGCFNFHAYLKERPSSSDYRSYSFGKLDDFIEREETVYPRVMANYDVLRQDSFITGEQFCFLCPDVKKCGVCPVYAAQSTGFIGRVAPWMCTIARILRRGQEAFLEEIGSENA